MGIQLNVELKDIPKEWKRWVKETTYPDQRCMGDECPQCGGDGCETIVRNLVVEVPQIGEVQSYTEDSLCFDNKFANMEIRAVLDYWGVPYTRG